MLYLGEFIIWFLIFPQERNIWEARKRLEWNLTNRWNFFRNNTLTMLCFTSSGILLAIVTDPNDINTVFLRRVKSRSSSCFCNSLFL